MKKDFSGEYFFDEVRDGFFIPSMTKKCWALSYKNYGKLRETCKREGLNVYAMWGTLLGAIRHGGYVPWDDDMDTAMYRSSYNMLREMEIKGKLPDEYWICDYEHSADENMTRNWVDTKSIVRTLDQCKDSFGYPMYDPIDIFVLDTIPKDETKRKIHKNIIESLALLGSQARLREEQKVNGTNGVPRDDIVDEKTFLTNLKRITKKLGTDIDPYKGDAPLFIRIFRLMDKYCSDIDDHIGDDVGILTYYVNSGLMFEKKAYSHTIDMPFEYGSMTVPAGYDGILRRCYGSYMYPVSDGGGHGYPFYRELEKQMKDLVGVEYFTYHFSKDEYDKVIDSRECIKDIVQELRSGCELFDDAHDYIINKLSSGDMDTSLNDVISQCQDLAVYLGERIESSSVNGAEDVRVFENYCELIYEIYEYVQGVSTKDGVDTDEQTVQRLYTGLCKYRYEFGTLCESIRVIKTVVLLCYRASNWKSLHDIYTALVKRDDVKVIVIQVPYYMKNYDGSIDKEHMILESDGYPDGIEFMRYNQIDMERLHPNVIVNQWPYDDYNESVCIHPYYYNKNLYRYTDKLVFIPPFVTGELEGNDRLRATLAFFADMPGFIYSDEIIVQSEQAADEYVKMLDRFICEEMDTDKQDVIDLKAKIKGTGSAIYDWNSKKRSILLDEDTGIYYDKSGSTTSPEIYDVVTGLSGDMIQRLRHENGGFKKIFVFYISGSMLYDHGVRAIDKMRRVLEYVYKIDDILIWWYMDPYAKDILDRYESDTWRAFCSLRDEFTDRDMGLIDDSKDGVMIRDIADMYYGDASEVMNHMRERGVPVCFETPDIDIDTPDDYEYKRWTDETVIAIEGEWYLKNFIDEALRYEKKISYMGYADIIANEIIT